MATNILILDQRAGDYGRSLKALFPDLTINLAATVDDFRGQLNAIDVLIAFGLSVSDGFLREAIGLKWIQALGTGVDYFQRSPDLRSNVILTSARGIHGPAMRENVIFLMQSISRDAAGIVDRQKEHRWKRVPWPLLHGKTAVILGTGISGTAIAEGLKALGMTVIGVTRTPRDIKAFDHTVSLNDLTKAAAEADYLINVMPGDSANKGLIGVQTFRAMKPSAYFVNVGRGDSVDEDALIDALQNKTISGAALDVFRSEPLPPDNPLWQTSNVFLTPHTGGLFVEYLEHVVPLIAENMHCFLEGRFADMRNRVTSSPDRDV